MKLWNTMPIRRRTGSGAKPGALMSMPSNTIAPSSIGSSRLVQRSMVDLPDPEAPMSDTTWPASMSRSMPSRTTRSPKDFRTLR
jgi:hypothetical protein